MVEAEQYGYTIQLFTGHLYNVQKWSCIRKQTWSHSRGDAYKYASQFRAKAIELEQSQMK